MKPSNLFIGVFAILLLSASFAVAQNDALVNSTIKTVGYGTGSSAYNSSVYANTSYNVSFETSSVSYNRTIINITFPSGFTMTNAYGANTTSSTAYGFLNGTYNNSIGFTLLLLLMAVVTLSDLLRLFRGQ